jgi:hypothetical protein
MANSLNSPSITHFRPADFDANAYNPTGTSGEAEAAPTPYVLKTLADWWTLLSSTKGPTTLHSGRLPQSAPDQIYPFNHG